MVKKIKLRLQLSRGNLTWPRQKNTIFAVSTSHCEYLIWLINTEKLLNDLPALCTEHLLLSSSGFKHPTLQHTALLSQNVEAPYTACPTDLFGERWHWVCQTSEQRGGLMDGQLCSVDGHCEPSVHKGHCWVWLNSIAQRLPVPLGLCWLQDAQGAFREAIYYVCNQILAFLLCFCK